MRSKDRSISAVLATYQGEAHIEAQIESILQQTQPVSEIVISDDASTDDTVDRVVASLVGSSIPYKLLRNEDNVGYVANFERAMRAADGDVIILSDQDDTWYPDRVERSMAALSGTTSMVFGDAAIIGEADVTMWQRLDFDQRARARFLRDPFRFLMRGNVVMGASAAFTRDLLDLALPIPDVAFHDYWLACVSAAVGTLRPLDGPVLNYRQHDGNASGGAPAAAAVDRARGRLSQAGYTDRRVHLNELSNRLRASLPEFAEIAARGAIFLAFRDALPSRKSRARLIVHHAINRDYHLFSRGLGNALYDLLR